VVGRRGQSLLAACLGPLELRVLEALWRRPSEAGVRSLAPDFPGIAYTTLMTTLDRLYKKDLLVRRKVGKAFAYVARHGREELEAILAREAIEDLLPPHTSGGPVLSGFVEAVGGRDERMLDELERLVRRYRAASRRKERGR
jgi:predicted transcriptional regulator